MFIFVVSVVRVIQWLQRVEKAWVGLGLAQGHMTCNRSGYSPGLLAVDL